MSEDSINSRHVPKQLEAKRCARCLETKTVDEFYPCPLDHHPTGISSHCKKCAAERRKANREAARDAIAITSFSPDKVKECKGCHVVKHASEFYPAYRWNDCLYGVQENCKECADIKRSALKTVLDLGGTKYCIRCQETKPLDQFCLRRRVNGAYTVRHQCKACRQKKINECIRKKPEKYRRTALNSAFRRQFGITLDQYEALFAAQNGLCAICHNPETQMYRHGNKTGVKRLAVDHDHGSNAVRGLLCFDCNVAIGKLNENPTLLRAAADYLERHGRGQEQRIEKPT